MNKSICAAPWKVLHISPQGNVYSCYESSSSLGNIYDTSLSEVWNNQSFQSLRQKMLDGEFASQCEKCYQKEKVLNGKSLRTQLNHELGIEDLRSKIASLTPSYLDLALSNTCNLKCRICGPYYSSSWLNDIPEQQKQQVKLRAVSPEVREHQVETLLHPGLKKIVFAGGEPLLEKQNDLILKKLIDLGQTQIQIEYNTNATTLREETLSLWKSFAHVRCNFSLDDFGTQFEYLRKGASWHQAVANIKQVKLDAPHVKLNCYTTINIFNVLNYPLLVRELRALELFNISEINLHYLVDPDYLNVQVLDELNKKKVEKIYYDFFKTYLLKNYDFDQVQNLILQMKMVVNYMFEKDLSHLREKFMAVTDQLDQKRSENYRLLFPHLD